MIEGRKRERINSLITSLAAEFLERESGTRSLITVTRAELSNNANCANIFFTVLPDSEEEAALEFAKRKRSEFRNFVASRAKIGKLPIFDFVIDKGEKNRQRLDQLSN